MRVCVCYTWCWSSLKACRMSVWRVKFPLESCRLCSRRSFRTSTETLSWCHSSCTVLNHRRHDTTQLLQINKSITNQTRLMINYNTGTDSLNCFTLSRFSYFVFMFPSFLIVSSQTYWLCVVLSFFASLSSSYHLVCLRFSLFLCLFIWHFGICFVDLACF